MTAIYTHINHCRSCSSDKIEAIMSLGELAISDFTKTGQLPTLAPLSLALCHSCNLLQLNTTAVDADLLYRQYWYKSGINQSMRDALNDVISKAESLVKLSSGEIVLDIGANDGTLLRCYNNQGLQKIGFEPAINLIAEAISPSNQIINNFFNAEDFLALKGSRARAKVITSIAMFYDLENPNQFVGDISKILAPEGIWINQLSYLPAMIRENAFDNICHEHIEYYSLSSLQTLLTRHGLEVFDVEQNNVNGGSFRVYARHKNAKINSRGGSSRISKLFAEEKLQRLDQKETYSGFIKKIASIRKLIKNFIAKERSSGKTIAIYGASTKGNTLLQYFNLTNKEIILASDRNPAKWGTFTVKTNIPIVSEQTARAHHPDYFLVLPWHFKAEFIEREQDYLQSGGSMIFPLPSPHIVTMKNNKLIEIDL